MNKSRQHSQRISYYPVGIFCLLVLQLTSCACTDDQPLNIVEVFILANDSTPVIGEKGIYSYDSVVIVNETIGAPARFEINNYGIILLSYDADKSNEIYSIKLSSSVDLILLGIAYEKRAICNSTYRYPKNFRFNDEPYEKTDYLLTYILE